MRADNADILVMVGLLMIGGALIWVAGLPGLLGYVGGLFVAWGLVVAMQRGRKAAK